MRHLDASVSPVMHSVHDQIPRHRPRPAKPRRRRPRPRRGWRAHHRDPRRASSRRTHRRPPNPTQSNRTQGDVAGQKGPQSPAISSSYMKITLLYRNNCFAEWPQTESPRMSGQRAVYPPSSTSVWPVMPRAPSLAKYAAASATSETLSNRPCGTSGRITSASARSLGIPRAAAKSAN